MKLISAILSLIFVFGCSTSTKSLKSDFQKVGSAGTGALLTVNLQTNGKVRADKNCHLVIESEKERFNLTLQRGVSDYALPLNGANESFEITQIKCGPFYYYDLKNQGTAFKIQQDKIKYLGFVNFKLKDQGELEWGHAVKDPKALLDKVKAMGLSDNSMIEISLLNL